MSIFGGDDEQQAMCQGQVPPRAVPTARFAVDVSLAGRVDEAFTLCELEQTLLAALDIREVFIARLRRSNEGNSELR